MATDLDLVTGAFGNTGSAIARLLHREGRRVRTLTNHPPEGGDGDRDGIDVHPLAFDDPVALTAAFQGVDTFYNTFWMRTGDGSGYDTPVARSRLLLDAARRAGVTNIVQMSVVKPAIDSRYPYFRGKAQVEEAARATGLPVAVVRPALIFGGDSVLLHNLAWILRRAPVFALAGDGTYRVRPVHLSDVARLCVEAGIGRSTATIDAVGPERPTYAELVTDVRDTIGSRTRLVRLPPSVVLGASKVVGLALRDQLLTREELESTMEGLADSDQPATGTASLHDWLADHAEDLGRSYRNERASRRLPSGR
jgi:uncharacterized protein YbjT (DUF2867 family)